MALDIGATVMTYPFKEFLFILLIIIIIKSSSWFHPWPAQNEWCLEWKVQQDTIKGEKKDYLLQTIWASNRLYCYLQYHIQESLLWSLLPPSTFSELAQQDSTKKRTPKKCVKHDKAITCILCCNLHLTLLCSGLLQKDLFKGKWNIFFK